MADRIDSNPPFTVRPPSPLTVWQKDHETLTLDNSAEIMVDATTNLVFLGGWVADDPSVTEFKDGSKHVRFPLRNEREWRRATGETQKAPCSRYLKFTGTLAMEAEKLGVGSRIVVSGFMNDDVIPNGNGEGKDKYLPNILVRDMRVIHSVAPSTKQERRERKERKVTNVKGLARGLG